MAIPGNQPIIIKKIKKGGHAHHGGAWKIAYADFVTAMMAFFLLLWLISMTTPEQKKGLADYFAPPNVSESTSGAGGVMGGQAFSADGAKIAVDSSTGCAHRPEQPGRPAAGIARRLRRCRRQPRSEATRASNVPMQSQHNADFHSAAASIRQAWQADPEITTISDSLLVEETEEGLNIQIIDQEGRPMFPEGSKYPYEETRKAIAALGPILERLSRPIAISGRTAAGASYTNPRYGAWDLSSDRVNTVRSILGEFGLSDDRLQSVTGRAAADPLFPQRPLSRRQWPCRNHGEIRGSAGSGRPRP